MKKWLETAHFEMRSGTQDQARDYCMKEESRTGGPWERGIYEKLMGKRNDLLRFREAVKEGATKLELMEEHADVMAKYPRYATEYGRILKESLMEKMPDLVPKYPYQEKILTICTTDPNPRTIHWVYDPCGNHGKTFLSKYLVQKYNAYYTNGGKATDLTYAYNGEGVVIFDYVRDAKEYVGYGVIEQLKNGILFSSKYESSLKRFPVPHVFVFANFMPAEGKFSEDRLHIMELNSIGQII